MDDFETPSSSWIEVAYSRHLGDAFVIWFSGISGLELNDFCSYGLIQCRDLKADFDSAFLRQSLPSESADHWLSFQRRGLFQSSPALRTALMIRFANASPPPSILQPTAKPSAIIEIGDAEPPVATIPVPTVSLEPLMLTGDPQPKKARKPREAGIVKPRKTTEPPVEQDAGILLLNLDSPQ